MRWIFNIINSNEGLNNYCFEQYMSGVSPQIYNGYFVVIPRKTPNLPLLTNPLVQSQIGETPKNELTSPLTYDPTNSIFYVFQLTFCHKTDILKNKLM